MRKKLIIFLLKMLGHNTDKTVITIEVDADDAIKTLKKIQFELEKINEGINKLPKGVVEFKEHTSKV